MSVSVEQRDQISSVGSERCRSRAAYAKARFIQNLGLLQGIAACGEDVIAQIEQTNQYIASIETFESLDPQSLTQDELDNLCDNVESAADEAICQFDFLHDWREKLLSEELDKRIGPVLNEYATLKALFEQLGRIQSARNMLLSKALEDCQVPMKPDMVWPVLLNFKMNSVTVEELEEALRIRVRDALRPEQNFKTALTNLEELSFRTRSCIQTETAQLHEEMRNSDAIKMKVDSILSMLLSSKWPVEKQSSFHINPGSAFEPTCEGAFQDSRGAKRLRAASEASSIDEDVQDRLNATQTSIQSMQLEGEGIDSPIIMPHMTYASFQETPFVYRGDYYMSSPPITKDFTTVTNPESNARVHITTCSCVFEEGGHDVQFQWMYFVYRSPYYRELTFEFDHNQVVSVVLPQMLIVVDSVCECISRIPSTVAALKSKKKGFFRALTGLGYAHKIMAKRDKKFQNQAWTATVAGIKQWLNRVRTFSPNALMIEDSDVVRLDEFIDTRVSYDGLPRMRLIKNSLGRSNY